MNIMIMMIINIISIIICLALNEHLIWTTTVAIAIIIIIAIIYIIYNNAWILLLLCCVRVWFFALITVPATSFLNRIKTDKTMHHHCNPFEIFQFSFYRIKNILLEAFRRMRQHFKSFACFVECVSHYKLSLMENY